MKSTMKRKISLLFTSKHSNDYILCINYFFQDEVLLFREIFSRNVDTIYAVILYVAVVRYKVPRKKELRPSIIITNIDKN